MIITVTSAVGEGPTPIAAFGAALLKTGAAYYNFLHLSSAIPEGSEIVVAPYQAPAHEFGWRKYAVISRREITTAGEQAWAGLGWVQDDSGKGIFVEIQGESEAAARRDIENSLRTMVDLGDLPFGPINQHVTGITCTGQPVCALVMAIFEASGGWPA